MERNIITTDIISEEKQFEKNLKPKYLDEYISQEKIKSNIKIYIDAAKLRNESLDHVLFYGPPGLGKTTLSSIIAGEMGVNLKITSGPAIEKPGEIAAILSNLSEGDVLFIDEIHRLNRQVEEGSACCWPPCSLRTRRSSCWMSPRRRSTPTRRPACSPS